MTIPKPFVRRLYLALATVSLLYGLFRLAWNAVTSIFDVLGDATFFSPENNLHWLAIAGVFFIAYEVRVSHETRPQ